MGRRSPVAGVSPAAIAPRFGGWEASAGSVILHPVPNGAAHSERASTGVGAERQAGTPTCRQMSPNHSRNVHSRTGAYIRQDAVCA